VTVWNSGDLPLEPDKIRNPLQILLTGGDTRVLDARVDYSTNNNISNFGFTETYKNIGGKEIKINENGVTEIHWKHFDPGEGFRFKIIYESREMQMVMLKGVILGIKNFSDITPPPKGTISFKAPGFVQTAIAGVFSVALIITAVVVRIRRRGQQQSPTQRFVLFGIMGGTVLFQLWASFAILRPPSPPF
jgi:hypothetical protein